jgi:hypothetical protein
MLTLIMDAFTFIASIFSLEIDNLIHYHFSLNVNI